MATDTLTETEFELRKAEEEARLAALRVAGVTPPSGRMWMGGNISQDQFNQLPQGARIAPPAPPMQPPRGLLDIYREGDQPGSRTISVRPWTPSITSADPTERRFSANEQIQRAVGHGMPKAEAIAMYGQGLFAPSSIPKPNQITPINLGRGGVATFDKTSGAFNMVREPAAYTTPELSPIEGKQLAAAYAEVSRIKRAMSDPFLNQNIEQLHKEMDSATKVIEKYNSRIAKDSVTAPTGTKKTLTRAKAEEFKNLAGGSRAKAEALARAEGYEF